MRTRHSTPSGATLAIFTAAIFFLGACVSPPRLREAYKSRLRSARLEARNPVPPPNWTSHPPAEAGIRYFVGESRDLRDKEQSLESAWVSALVRIGMTEFPETGSVSSQSVETLKSANFERRFVVRLERVDWTGLREASEMGSPYIDWDSRTGKYNVFRLLKWSGSDIAAARQQMLRAGKHAIPSPPEASERDEKRLIAAVRAMQELGEKIQRRNHYFDTVFSKVRCGMTVADLINVLGSPDQSNPYNPRIFEKEYYWGRYKVERIGEDPAIAFISDDFGSGAKRVVCNEAPRKLKRITD